MSPTESTRSTKSALPLFDEALSNGSGTADTFNIMPGGVVSPNTVATSVVPRVVRTGDLGAQLGALIATGTQGFPREGVIEQPTPAVLAEAKAKLQRLGVANLTNLGSITLAQDLQAQPGLISPSTFASDNVDFG